jgi:predicted metal-dependent phosphoesterase TrpH
LDISRDGVSPLTQSFVDLHLHSTASDGEVEPAGVVERAAAAGVVALALTDHDTMGGLPEAIEAGARLGVRVVAGCEFSVSAPWGEMHVLGYFLPLDSPAIEQFLTDRRQDRRRRAGVMVDKLGGLGIGLDLEDVLAVAGGAALGRPHVARALVNRGVVTDMQAAFDQYLGWGRPAFEAKVLPSFADLATLVHSVGGVLSAAHLKDRGSRSNLQRLRNQGLDAVEVRHPRHSADLRYTLERRAESVGLLPTGGSDWHGDAMAGSTHATIGSQRVPEEWLDRLEASKGPAG